MRLVNGHSSINFGPTLSLNGIRSSGADDVVYSYYLGGRASINPEFNFDARIGFIEGNQSPRVDIQGQFPVYNFGKNSRVYVGFNVNTNIGASSSDDVDSLRVFASWKLDFRNYFKSSTNVNFSLPNQQQYVISNKQQIATASEEQDQSESDQIEIEPVAIDLPN